MRTVAYRFISLSILTLLYSSSVSAFQSTTPSKVTASRASLISRRAISSDNHDESLIQSAAKIAATASLCALLSTTAAPLPAQAYNPDDFASDTVKNTIQLLQSAKGDADATSRAYETLGEIIAEGAGVGGAINYKGVQLERGYVADEDTTIYNPGLTLLTESEKERLLAAVIENRQAGLSSKVWNEQLDLGFSELKMRLDPLHMNELKGYLSIFPFYAAAVYVAVLGVQQFVRGLFPAAYLVGVAAVFGPVLALVASGP